MISTLVFSKDRPAQLDLCLRSLAKNLPYLYPVTVLYRATSAEYHTGYGICRAEHESVTFLSEAGFQEQVLRLVRISGRNDDFVFLCDDDVAFRAPLPPIEMVGLLHQNPDWLCFSLRLGINTTECYPLRQGQPFPTLIRREGHLTAWEWRKAESDWSYAGSLDGHVFRTYQLVDMLTMSDWDSPNTLEECLQAACQEMPQPLMASFTQSVIVGIPANRVQATHPNRNGETHPADPKVLNDRYLQGDRLDLASVKPELVTGAHTEMALGWLP